MSEFFAVGKRIPKIDAEEKVTGKAVYIQDLKIPGMLWGKILYSPYPHARILHIDTSAAERLPGVKAVLTGYNTPLIKFGFYKDNMPLKRDKVRSCRDEVAAVAATDPDIAAEAIERIKVEYELLPAVFDPEEAMKEGAPLIHEDHLGGKEKKPTNVLNLPWRLVAGDVEEARKNSAYIAEDRFRLTWVNHCCMGTSGCIALFDPRDNLTLYSNTQIPSLAQRDFTEALAAMGLEGKRARVIKTKIGGAFGSKLDTYAYEYIAILLAHKTRKPVKIVFTREEEFFATSPRQPAIIDIAQGCTKEGLLTFRDVRMVLDNGAYTSWGATTPSVMMMPTSSLYKVPNVRYVAKCVYTNNTYCQAFRGYGNPQATFAIESQMDILAEMAGIDPLDFRMRNANTAGEVTPQRFHILTCGLGECIDAVAQKLDWRQKRGRRNGRGVGMASLIHVGGGARVYKSDGCGTIIKVDDFGTVNVITGATDMGQGADTVIAQIVAEELGVRVEDVVITHTDTDICPWDVGAHASRTTYVAGNSARIAAKKVKEQILEVASRVLGENPEHLDIRDRVIYSKVDPEKKSPLGKILRASHYSTAGRMVMAEHFYDPPNENLDKEFKGNLSVTYAYGTHGVEVEVDRKTGQVKILKYIAAHDVGRAINPMLLEGQVYGGAAMGIGYALMEQLVLKEGKVLNPDFRDYKILTAADMPPIETVVIETDDPTGPFGAKGIGEPGLVPTAPAIANAIFDAIGVRIKDLPITPEKILKALKDKGH
ncbi:MAG: xanthine dehydrogenase family protein molybdopterin-binding subunit [Desulfobacterota bacterium]|nr:xanthine dehydrogenase family protein molybdopterin-binding subunit [Thermodesulfobacteriota bacterium]